MARYTEQFRAADPIAPAVARKVHIAINEVLERDRKESANSGDIRCRKGCDHCCRGPVEIWPQEAALLVEIARKAGVEIDQARLERQNRYTMDNWQEQPAAELHSLPLPLGRRRAGARAARNHRTPRSRHP